MVVARAGMEEMLSWRYTPSCSSCHSQAASTPPPLRRARSASRADSMSSATSASAQYGAPASPTWQKRHSPANRRLTTGPPRSKIVQTLQQRGKADGLNTCTCYVVSTCVSQSFPWVAPPLRLAFLLPKLVAPLVSTAHCDVFRRAARRVIFERGRGLDRRVRSCSNEQGDDGFFAAERCAHERSNAIGGKRGVD